MVVAKAYLCRINDQDSIDVYILAEPFYRVKIVRRELLNLFYKQPLVFSFFKRTD